MRFFPVTLFPSSAAPRQYTPNEIPLPITVIYHKSFLRCFAMYVTGSLGIPAATLCRQDGRNRSNSLPDAAIGRQQRTIVPPMERRGLDDRTNLAWKDKGK